MNEESGYVRRNAAYCEEFSDIFRVGRQEPTQPPIQWVPGALSPGVKRQGREADHSLPSSAEVKNGGAISPLLHTSSWNSA
jgi:hypothetical protein